MIFFTAHVFTSVRFDLKLTFNWFPQWSQILAILAREVQKPLAKMKFFLVCG